MKLPYNLRRQLFLLGLAFESQIVPCTLDDQQFGLCWNQLACRFDLLDRAEGIAGSMHKECRDMEVMQVLCPWLVSPAGRVQWIRKQKQPVCELVRKCFFREKHACLTSAIALSANEHAS